MSANGNGRHQHRFVFPGTEVIFGSGSFARLLRGAPDTSGRTLVVAGAGVRGNDLAAGIIRSALADRSAGWYGTVEPTTSIANLRAAVAVARREGADRVIAIGGGSAIGLAKMIAAATVHSGSVDAFLDLFRAAARPAAEQPRVWPAVPRLELWVVPTTLSGSEINGSTSVADGASATVQIRGLGLAPDRAIYDSMLAATTPRGVFSAVVFNSLDHAIEIYCSRYSDPFVDAMALQAISAFASCIGDLADQSPESYEDAVGRAQVAGCISSSWIHSKMILEDTGHGIAHALGHTLRRECGVAQGVAHAIVMPAVITRVAGHVPGRVAAVEAALGRPAADAGQPCGEYAADLIRAWRRELGLPSRLRDVGVTKQMCAEVAARALQDRSVRCAAFDVGESDLSAVLDASW